MMEGADTFHCLQQLVLIPGIQVQDQFFAL